MYSFNSITVIGVVAVLAWLYLLVGNGRFWQVQRSLIAVPGTRTTLGSIAVVIPARDEADVIARSITSLLSQQWEGTLHIFLVDDASSDQSAQIAGDAARRLGKSNALTVIKSRALPAGWSGKLWAVQQGIEQALKLNPDFLLLSDADIVHGAGSVADLVAVAEAGGYDLASLMVKLHCCCFAEKLLIPAFVFFFFKLYPPVWIADAQRRTAGAAGGCILIRPEALLRAGGVEAIRNEIIDDCALARAVKRTGGRVFLGLAESTTSIRPYGSFREIGRMISRSAFNQLRHSTLMLLGAFAGLAIIYLAPPLLLFSGHLLPAALGGLAWLLMTVAYFPMVRFYALNPLWALTLPAAAMFYMGATFVSAVNFWTGRGGQWKGRAQDVRETTAV